MKRILITGGLGHIGNRMCNYLLNNNYEVSCLDNFKTQRYISLKGLLNRENFSFTEIDIVNEIKKLKKIIDNNNYDALIHLAAITDATTSFENKTEIQRNNFYSTKNIVNICLENDLRLIYPSSTSVYGFSESIVDESDKKFLNPQSPYAETKLKEEKFIQDTLKENYFILRLGTIFGISNGIRFHTAVNKFCYQAALGLPITVWKTAMDQYRPYLDINDACRAADFFIHKCNPYGIYNVNTFNLTVRDIIEEIKIHKKSLDIIYVKTKIMNQLSYFVSNKKILKTGFVFKGSLSKSISDTLNWFN